MKKYEYRIDYHHPMSPRVNRVYHVNASSDIQAIQIFEYQKSGCVVDNVTCIYKKEKTMELKGKVSVELTEDDIKEIIAHYMTHCENFPGSVTKDNIEFVYGTVEVGTQMYPHTKPVLKKCKIRM